MIDTLRHFLAHAVKLESSAAEGYAVLAAQMRELGQGELGALFQQLGAFSQLHRDETVRRYQAEVGDAQAQVEDYHWPDGRPPEDPQMIECGPGLTPRHALELALKLEQAACDYYVGVAGQSVDGEVQELAQAFAEEEAEHVAALERWIARMDGRQAPGTF